MKSDSAVNSLEPGLNLMTLLKASIEEGIEAAAGAGFRFVELWVDPLEKYLETHSPEDLRRLLNAHGVRVLSIGDIESITFCSNEQFAKLRAQCAHLAAVAREIGGPALVVSGSVKPRGVDAAGLATELRTVLGKLLDVVEPEDVGLAIAFRGFSWCSLNGLAQAVEAVKYYRERRVGLALDTFHLHAARTSPQVLEKLDPAKIFFFRFSDCANVSPVILTETGRLLPGEGVAELDAMLQALTNSGFRGAVSLKVLSPRLLDSNPKEIARAAMAAVQPYLAKAF